MHLNLEECSIFDVQNTGGINLVTVYFLNINLKYNLEYTSEIALREKGERVLFLFSESTPGEKIRGR